MAFSPNAAVFLELGWPDALHLCTERLLSLFGRALSMPCGERCPLPALIFLPGFMGVSLRQFVRLFGCSPSKCVRHWASLFRPLCSSLVPDSRRSSSEPFLARPSCCCCFPALSLPCPCFVTCGERWSASDRAWTFFHSFFLGGLPVGVMTRFPGVEQRGTLVSLCRAFCVRLPLVTCSTV